MHSLIITAHPSTQGFTHAIAQKYQETKERNGHTVELLNLYTTELHMDFYHYEEKADMKAPDPVREALQAKITAADELVFVFPVWNVNVPAILKNFIDGVFTGGFAYQYTKETIIFPKNSSSERQHAYSVPVTHLVFSIGSLVILFGSFSR